MFTFSAPAKLNLFLHVIGRREDGYHLLQTVFRFIDYSDQLSFRLRTDGIIKLHNPIAGVPEEKDLCVRAAILLKQATGTQQGVDIFLQKQIPMGGGLGGGSSDAATTLLALNYLWKVNLSKQHLLKLGLQLGADIPIFIFGENAFAEGIGEKLTSIKLPPAWYVVLVPPVQVSTAEIFASKDLTRNTIPIKIPPFSVWQGHNDLELPVCRSYSEVAQSLEWLKRQENTTITAMSGSGACVFAEFASEAAAQAVFEHIPDSMAGFMARGLDYHPMQQIVK
ncbi:4-(cytidine 5'-diphospho)-2-C-methyl-D-erythritol kinase [Nitrosomonas supralitoralis]|uniref:4-diphosphocytidyl-2-C-methyl-D-erythritol kinase n=1 Tax=Nitrosomonas supralitoralis TaxID=2116706 RepID=A0A2P7NUH4_9PROT|nr:4-(cytidine 5'-diphospho)-2-C-methyl-D-erythritol kinase [Nitrosomonas supralitoralis]PSJ17124.1 4-(cytidine 5'-diphospho)-2-C-methyl-D-erythritol kinase [Nitrosomonas supralitoralis]